MPRARGSQPSLCIKAGDTQPVVLRCHAGCRFEAITVALNLDRPMRVMDKVIDLPAPHKDVSDFIDAGGNVNVLADACKAAPEWGPSDAPAAPVARLEPITEFTPEPTPWVIPGWLAAGEFHLLAGQAGMGKSTLAMKIAAMVSRSQDFNGEPCAGGDVALWSGGRRLQQNAVATAARQRSGPGTRSLRTNGGPWGRRAGFQPG